MLTESLCVRNSDEACCCSTVSRASSGRTQNDRGDGAGGGADVNGWELESSGGFFTHVSGAWTVMT